MVNIFIFKKYIKCHLKHTIFFFQKKITHKKKKKKKGLSGAKLTDIDALTVIELKVETKDKLEK